MAQEYFSHDYNSRNDRKMVAFLNEHKAKGLGVYWTVIELLHEEGGYLPLDIITFTSIGSPLGCTPEYVQKVVEDCIDKFKLLKSEDGRFTSDRVLKNLNKRKEIREIRAKAGKASAASKSSNSTHVEQMPASVEQVLTHVEQNSTNKKKRKERKRKERVHDARDLSESNLFRKPIIPTLEQVHEVFLRSGGTSEMATKFFESNASVGWFLRGSPIKDFSKLVPGYISAWNERAPPPAQNNPYEQKLAEARKNYKPLGE